MILCLDADHVPLPDALDAIVGYFDDDGVALVQTPHDFYNHDSVQHYEVGRHEQNLFFQVVCPGKDRHNGVYWCGSASLLRRKALVEIGGVSTETIAEDFHTTIKLHEAGWKTCYHDEVLVQGLAPMDLDGYLLQRDRWARGNLAVLTLPESPLRPRSGLSLRQRVSYLGSLFAYGAGAARLAMIALLVVVLAAGVLPARMAMLSLAVFWAPWTIFAVMSASALCRGHLRMGESSHYTLVTAAVFTRALRCAIIPSRTKFKVTPKEGADPGGVHALGRVRLVTSLGAALAGALVWRGLGLLGYVHPRALPAWAATFAMILGTWELYRIVRSLQIVLRRCQRRNQFRFSCLAPATLTGEDQVRSYGRVVDVSTSGLGVLVGTQLALGTNVDVSFSLPGLEGETLLVTLVAAVCSVRPDWWMGQTQPPGWRLGLSVLGIDDGSRRNVVEYCFVVHPWARLRESLLEAEDVLEPSRIEAVPHLAIVGNDDDGETETERPAVG